MLPLQSQACLELFVQVCSTVANHFYDKRRETFFFCRNIFKCYLLLHLYLYYYIRYTYWYDIYRAFRGKYTQCKQLNQKPFFPYYSDFFFFWNNTKAVHHTHAWFIVSSAVSIFSPIKMKEGSKAKGHLLFGCILFNKINMLSSIDYTKLSVSKHCWHASMNISYLTWNIEHCCLIIWRTFFKGKQKEKSLYFILLFNESFFKEYQLINN